MSYSFACIVLECEAECKATGEGSGNNYAYLVVDDKSKDAVIIDPANPSEVLPVLKKQIDSGAINLKSIINTHQ